VDIRGIDFLRNLCDVTDAPVYKNEDFLRIASKERFKRVNGYLNDDQFDCNNLFFSISSNAFLSVFRSRVPVNPCPGQVAGLKLKRTDGWGLTRVVN